MSDHFLIRATFAVDRGMTVRNDRKLMEVYYYKMNKVRLRHLFLAEVEKELTLSPNLDMEGLENLIKMKAEEILKTTYLKN